MRKEDGTFTTISERKGIINYSVNLVEGESSHLIEISGTAQRAEGELLPFKATGRDLRAVFEGAFGFVEGRKILEEHQADLEERR